MSLYNLITGALISEIDKLSRQLYIPQRRAQAAEIKKQARESVDYFMSDKGIRKIWNQPDYLQETSLCNLVMRVEQLTFRNRVELERLNGKSRAFQDPVYLARMRAIEEFETKVIPRYETAFGNLDRFKLNLFRNAA